VGVQGLFYWLFVIKNKKEVRTMKERFESYTPMIRFTLGLALIASLCGYSMYEFNQFDKERRKQLIADCGEDMSGCITQVVDGGIGVFSGMQMPDYIVYATKTQR
jgi:hypothetical protein